MALQDYARLAVFYNDSLLTQITSLSITNNSGNQRVDVMNEGFAGFTPGSGDVTVEVGFVVPAGGTEEDFQGDCDEKRFVKLQVVVGSKDYIGTGKLDTCNVSQSTGGSTEGNFTWIGEPGHPE